MSKKGVLDAKHCGEKGGIEQPYSQDKIENFHISKYRTDYNEEASRDILSCASIENMAKFGPKAESYLIETFLANRKEFALQESDKNEEPEYFEDDNEDLTEIYGLEYSVDEHGHLNDEEIKYEADPAYPYNALILEKLSQLPGKKSIDFAADFLFDDYNALFIYKEEMEKIFKKDAEHSTEKIFSRIEKNKYPRETIKIIILVACDLIGLDAVKARLESFLGKGQREEIDFLYSILQVAKEKGEKIDLRTIKNLNFYTKEIGQDLSEEEKREILEIARENYFNGIFKNNPAAAEDVIKDLEFELTPAESEKQRKYLLKYKGEVIAFCRFKPAAEGEVYAGSLNVHSELKALSMGKYFSDKALAEEAKTHIIKMKSRADNSCNKLYEAQGFIETGRAKEKRGDLEIEYIYYKMDKR